MRFSPIVRTKNGHIEFEYEKYVDVFKHFKFVVGWCF
jgi:hypothetical protein